MFFHIRADFSPAFAYSFFPAPQGIVCLRSGRKRASDAHRSFYHADYLIYGHMHDVAVAAYCDLRESGFLLL